MAITYFQDTIISTEALTAPATGTALEVAVNNLFSTKNYTFMVTVASINTNVIVRLEGSLDGTNYATLLANRTISANGSTFENVVNKPFKWLRPVFVSEAGGTAATVTLSIAAA
jgi:hypothetical protein|tara:strand:- start:370 stop:711 length:342 start_codon:yes stop_codon:yes gene_type:complete